MMLVSSKVNPRSQHSLSFLTGSRAEGLRGQGPRDTLGSTQTQTHTEM